MDDGNGNKLEELTRLAREAEVLKGKVRNLEQAEQLIRREIITLARAMKCLNRGASKLAAAADGRTSGD